MSVVLAKAVLLWLLMTYKDVYWKM